MSNESTANGDEASGPDAPAFPIIDRTAIARRVEALRECGVRFPDPYPPLNIGDHEVHLRGVLAQVEVLELLCAIHDPRTLVCEPEIEGGDVDVLIATDPPYWLQIKNVDALAVNPGGHESKIIQMMDQVKRDMRVEHAKYPATWTLYSAVRIRRGDDGSPVFDGRTWAAPRELPARVTAIELDADLARQIADEKIPDMLRRAISGLPRRGVAIRVPVLNLARYPHDQTAAYKLVRDHLRARGNHYAIGGAVLVATGFPTTRGEEGPSAPALRLLPILNPGAPQGLRLREADFNENHLDETMFQEIHVFWDFEQVHRGTPDPITLRDGDVFLGSTRLGPLPSRVVDGFAVTAARKPRTERLDEGIAGPPTESGETTGSAAPGRPEVRDAQDRPTGA